MAPSTGVDIRFLLAEPYFSRANDYLSFLAAVYFVKLERIESERYFSISYRLKTHNFKVV